MTSLTTADARPVTRVTSFKDHRRNKPVVIRLEAGGSLIRLKVKGERKWYTVTIKDVRMLAVRVRAEEIRREKAEARRTRKHGV